MKIITYCSCCCCCCYFILFFFLTWKERKRKIYKCNSIRINDEVTPLSSWHESYWVQVNKARVSLTPMLQVANTSSLISCNCHWFIHSSALFNRERERKRERKRKWERRVLCLLSGDAMPSTCLCTLWPENGNKVDSAPHHNIRHN